MIRLRALLPVATLAVLVAAWHWVVSANNLPPYVLPDPGLVLETLWNDRAVLFGSFLVTMRITLLALLCAVIGGVGLALVFASARIVELSLFPIAVILQVTPIVAVAPLMLIYLEPGTAVLVCAFVVAFFPILANTTLGLNTVDPHLRDLFALSGASRLQTLWMLRAPSALPYFLGGLRIAGGLSLIGAIVAEIAAGSAGQGSGLAFRIVESGYRLNIPRMFAALLLISLAGILIYFTLSLVSWLALRRWHESELPQRK